MLEAAAKPTLSLDGFEGPLDLLLQLIEQHQLDITTIALAEVADRYLQLVHTMAEPDPSVLANFLAIGARLLVIKTRALLPRSPLPVIAPEEDPGEQLARQLREYTQFKQVAASLKEREEAGLRTYLRIVPPPLPPRPQPTQTPTLDIGIGALHAAVERRMALLRSATEPTTDVPRPKVLTIADVADHLRRRLVTRPWITFDDLLSLAITRHEVIVTLWTVLELYKRQVIVFRQEGLFDQITLGRGDRFDKEQSAQSEEPLDS